MRSWLHFIKSYSRYIYLKNQVNIFGILWEMVYWFNMVVVSAFNNCFSRKNTLVCKKSKSKQIKLLRITCKFYKSNQSVTEGRQKVRYAVLCYFPLLLKFFWWGNISNALHHKENRFPRPKKQVCIHEHKIVFCFTFFLTEVNYPCIR